MKTTIRRYVALPFGRNKRVLGLQKLLSHLSDFGKGFQILSVWGSGHRSRGYAVPACVNDENRPPKLVHMIGTLKLGESRATTVLRPFASLELADVGNPDTAVQKRHASKATSDENAGQR